MPVCHEYWHGMEDNIPGWDKKWSGYWTKSVDIWKAGAVVGSKVMVYIIKNLRVEYGANHMPVLVTETWDVYEQDVVRWD